MLFFAPQINTIAVGDQRKVDVTASFVGAVGNKVSPTEVRFTLQQ